MITLVRRLTGEACEGGITYLESYSGDLEKAWKECPRGDWLIWCLQESDAAPVDIMRDYCWDLADILDADCEVYLDDLWEFASHAHCDEVRGYLKEVADRVRIDYPNPPEDITETAVQEGECTP